MTPRPLDIAFVVQGEGRGHMTQALAVRRFLADAGHRVVEVFLGTSPFRSPPRYFIEGIQAPVETFPAPTLVADAGNRAMSVVRTATYNLPRIPSFVSAGFAMRRGIRAVRPDVVVNFLDLIAGFVHVFTRWPPPPPRVAVGHTYLMGHPGAAQPPPGLGGRLGLALLARIAAIGAGVPLALSFDPLPPTARVHPLPPLLRPTLGTVDPSDGGYLLAYALNAGYARELDAWQARNPTVNVHCYLAGGARAAAMPSRPGFALHDLDDEAFLRHLAGCRAYAGTAGFEAVAEAFWLGKPVLAVPVERHYEQAFNAVDIRRAGMATVGTFSDLDRFWARLPVPEPQRVEAFRAWVAQAPARIVGAIEEAARRG
jgi:hypothetical protein